MKYHFFIFLNLFLVFSTKKIIAQESAFSFKINTGTTAVGGVYSDIQVGHFWISDVGDMIIFPKKITSLCAGIETNYLFKEDFRIVPKISFDYHHTQIPFSLGLQTRYYPAKNMDFSKASIQVCPHIGTNFLGVGYINFGYNWGLTNTDVTPNLGFQVNIGVNFPAKLLLELFN